MSAVAYNLARQLAKSLQLVNQEGGDIEGGTVTLRVTAQVEGGAEVEVDADWDLYQLLNIA